jgi:hypothetical protein
MRKLKQEEANFITALLTSKHLMHLSDRLQDYYVEECEDGGMGSLRFFNGENSRSFGKEVVEASVLDVDGIPVSFTVNLDQAGDIYELDVFKADFSPLKQFPLPPYEWL